jgi:hypothetical protein
VAKPFTRRTPVVGRLAANALTVEAAAATRQVHIVDPRRVRSWAPAPVRDADDETPGYDIDAEAWWALWA